MSVEASRLPYVISPATDDVEVAALIESWRYRGPSIGWEAIVGHAAQVRRCQEVVEALRRPAADLDRLRIRLGKGLVLVGPAGSGKTLMARAMAGHEGMGRDLIAIPVSELTPGLIARVYAQLARMNEPVAVLLDEAEPVLCQGFAGGEDDLVRALCIAIDGLEPRVGPITIALTTADAHVLAPTVTRAGRLAPRLELGLPSPTERRILLDRAVSGLPVTGPALDIGLAVQRTAGWSGAEIAVAIEEAMSRSLLERTDALTTENLMAVIAERYVIVENAPRKIHLRRIAEHECAHAIFGHLRIGGVGMVSLKGESPSTRLTEERFEALVTATDYRNLAAMCLAPIAAETIRGGVEGVGDGSPRDRAQATEWLVRGRGLVTPYEPDVLERGTYSDRGSERMRASIHATIEDDASRLLIEAIAELAPYGPAIEKLADSLMEADDHTLSGPTLTTAIEAALA